MQVITTRKDVIWNYLGVVFSMGSNFLLLPFLVYFLSDEFLGLWYVYVAIGNLVMLFEFGFNPTFARNFAFCWSGAKDLTREGRAESEDEQIDADLVAHLLAACKMVYGRIVVAAFVALSIFGSLYVLSVSAGLPRFDVLVSWLIYGSGVLVNLYYLYYAAMLRGIGAIAADNQIKIVARLMQIVITIVLLVAGTGLVGATLGFFVNALVYRVLGNRMFWNDSRVVKLELKTIEIDGERKKSLYKTISYNAYKDGAVQVSNFASTQASTLICSSFLGLAEAGAFSVALQLATGIGNIALALVNSYRPMMQSAYQRGDNGLFARALGRGALAYVVIFLMMFVAVLIVAYPLLAIVKPGSSYDPLVYCGVSIYMFLFNWHSLFAAALANMNKIPYMKAYIVTAAAGVALSVVLVEGLNLGVWGLVFGLALPQLLYNNWKWPLVASREVSSTVPELLKLGFASFRMR